MKKIFKIAIGLLVLTSAAATHAQMKAADIATAQAAFSANGCNSCHDPSSRTVGPALNEIAARYKGKKVAAEVAKRIVEGSEGRWGDMVHPPYGGLAPAEAKLLARWMLAGAPQ